MPVYQYQGQHYDLPDGLSNEAAIAKIKTHLGEKPKAASKDTSIGEDLKIGLAGVGKMVDTGVSLAASAVARPFAGQEAQDDIFKNLNERIESYDKWANPDKKIQKTGGKLISAIPGALGIPLAGFALPSTSKEMLDAGETLPKALAGGGIDAGLQFATMGIPMPGKGVAAKAVSTGLFNTGQNAAAEAAISGIADTKQIKEAHDPLDLDKALVSFVSGGVAGGAAKAIGNMKESRANKANADFDQRLKTAVEAKTKVVTEDALPKSNLPENLQFLKEQAESKQRDAQTVERLEAAIAKQNPENGTIYVNKNEQAMQHEPAQAYVAA